MGNRFGLPSRRVRGRARVRWLRAEKKTGRVKVSLRHPSKPKSSSSFSADSGGPACMGMLADRGAEIASLTQTQLTLKLLLYYENMELNLLLIV